MGFGTGVMNAFYVYFFVRGLTVGVSGACCLFISRSTGVPQNWLTASRGLGQIVGPVLCGRLIGKAFWSGESRTAMASALAIKAFAELLLPQLSGAVSLCVALCAVGLASGGLDAYLTFLVSRCYQDQAGKALIRYGATYSMGCMVAPFVAVACPNYAWHVLAGLDLAVASVLATKRLLNGKPRGWEEKIRGASNASGDPTDARPTAAKPPPRTVVVAGSVYTLFVQVVQTGISCWGFTFGVTSLGLPDTAAATIPSVFAFFFMATRFTVILPAASWCPPSTMLHIGTCITVISCTMLYWLSLSPPSLWAVLAVMAVLGMGLCPHDSMMLAAMQLQGNMTPQDHGWYGTCYSLGTMLGMWLPGLISLSYIELMGSLSMFLILNGRKCDFSRHAGKLPALCADGDVEKNA